MRLGIRLILLAASTGAVTSARAEWADFAPRALENGAYVEAYASGERDVSRNASQSSNWDDRFFREKVTLFSNGYVYHPRFLQYRVSASGLLKQESYDQSHVASSGWEHAAGAEYEGRLYLLPEHPYNLELFALRHEPLYRERTAAGHDSVETSNGANFRFRRRPCFVHAGYLDNTTTVRTVSSNVERLTLDGEYFKEFVNGRQVSASASFAPSRFDDDRGIEGHSRQYAANGLLNLQRARLDVTAARTVYDQNSPMSGTIDSEQRGFQERLNIDLPRHFQTRAYYRVQDNRTTTSDPSGAGLRELSDDSKDFEATLAHRLYESLDSRYTFQRNARTSSGGESTTVSHALGLDYSKRIPRGRVLSGVNLSTSDADSSGRTDVASESHSSTLLPWTFSLAEPNVEPGSLALFFRSPDPPFELIPLVEVTHYTTILVANTLQISVTALPPPYVPGELYELFVSYSLITGNFELRTDNYGFNTSVQLLDHLVTPYYSYLAVRSDLRSGTFPGSLPDSTTNTLGLVVQRGPWRGLGEYQSLDWEVSPYRAWRAEAQHIGSITPTLRVYATARYLDKYYPQGTSAGAPGAYTEKTASASASLQKDLRSRRVMLAAGGSYAHMTGIVDSNAYALNSSLTWRVGKLELSAGIDVYGSDSQGNGAGDNSRDRQLYYVRVLRRLVR